MNKIYKVVWSKAKHCYVVTSELAKRNTKGCGTRSLRMAAVSLGVAAALMGGVGFATSVAYAAGASDNTFTVTTDKTSNVYGGIAAGSDPGTDYRGGWSSNNADDANSNTITISSGTLSGNVYGGYTYYGDASHNAVTISGGTISQWVYGGYSSSAKANNNSITVEGGIINVVTGGYSSFETKEERRR